VTDDHYSGQRRRHEESGVPDCRWIVANRGGRRLLGKEAMELMVAALEGLPPRTREAFVLHRFEEMTYGAIARHMGVSTRTVEKLISRAIKKLTECARACS
jgi:RNA polymerase sigma factor (sigma-70 family)